MKARGGFDCDIDWSGGKLTKAAIRSEKGGKANVQYGSEKFAIDLEPGEEFVWVNN